MKKTISINEYSNMYDDINHHPDMMYELRLWDEIKEEMSYPEEDNNNDFVYGVYWLDDNDEVMDVQWFKSDQERYNEINETNKRLRNAFYGEPA